MKEKNEFIVEEYEINPNTYMLKPYIQGNRTWTQVMEDDGTLLTPESPMEIINRCCGYNGTDYVGRRNGTKALIKVTHKAPILIDPHTSIYILPTRSPTHPDCIWIVPEHIEDYWRLDKTTTVLEFQNKEKYEVPISFASLGNQIARAAELRVKYERNKQRMEMYLSNPKRKHFYFKASELNRPYEIKDK